MSCFICAIYSKYLFIRIETVFFAKYHNTNNNNNNNNNNNF